VDRLSTEQFRSTSGVFARQVADESGNDGKAPTKVGLGQALTAHPEAWPFVVIFPQKPRDEEEWWEEEPLTLDVVRRAKHDFHFDARKLALVGVSQGGYGAWMLGARYPTRWACLVPVSSYGRPRSIAARVARLPVWAFHGATDDVVDPEESKKIVEAIRAEHKRLDLEVDARYTVYPTAGHDAANIAWGVTTVAGIVPTTFSFAESGPSLVKLSRNRGNDFDIVLPVGMFKIEPS
jgi:predicted peptidase